MTDSDIDTQTSRVRHRSPPTAAETRYQNPWIDWLPVLPRVLCRNHVCTWLQWPHSCSLGQGLLLLDFCYIRVLPRISPNSWANWAHILQVWPRHAELKWSPLNVILFEQPHLAYMSWYASLLHRLLHKYCDEMHAGLVSEQTYY